MCICVYICAYVFMCVCVCMREGVCGDCINHKRFNILINAFTNKNERYSKIKNKSNVKCQGKCKFYKIK